MDFRQLESFVAIVKYGSFTKAAEELYLSQPTLTGHVSEPGKQAGNGSFELLRKGGHLD